MHESSPTSLLLRIPLEIRLHIYEYLLKVPSKVDGARRRLLSIPDYHEYQCTGDLSYVVSIRNMHPADFKSTRCRRIHRSSYWIHSDRFRADYMETSYTCVSSLNIEPAILGVSQQTHHEAAQMLYGSYTFDFDTNVEACVPFLKDLTPFTRSHIRHVSLVKRAIHHDQDFDRLHWASMCQYLAQYLFLKQLSLGVVALKPYVLCEWIEPLDKEALKSTRDVQMEWIKNLTSIRGLEQLNVRACIERCPLPETSAMNFFLAFSASVEKAVTDYLVENLIEAKVTPEVIAA